MISIPMTLTPARAGRILVATHSALALLLLAPLVWGTTDSVTNAVSMIYAPFVFFFVWSASPPAILLLGPLVGALLGLGVMRPGWSLALPFAAYAGIHALAVGVFGLAGLFLGHGSPGDVLLALLVWLFALILHRGGLQLVILSRQRPARAPEIALGSPATAVGGASR